MRGIVMSTNEVSLTAEKKKTIGLKIVTYIVSVLLALMVLLPFISMIREIFGDEVVILPTASGNFTVVTKPRETMMTWKEFTQLFNKPTWTAFGNLVLVTATSTILNIYEVHHRCHDDPQHGCFYRFCSDVLQVPSGK